MPHLAHIALLARAVTNHQATRIGNQTGGRVAFFRQTDNIARAHARFTAPGAKWARPLASHDHATITSCVAL